MGLFYNAPEPTRGSPVSASARQFALSVGFLVHYGVMKDQSASLLGVV